MVSVCQSIGATGTISAGAQAVTGAAVAGTSLGGKVIKGILKKKTSDKLPPDDTDDSKPWKSKL